MGKKLTNEQDVQSTRKSFEANSKILKFDENTKTPVYILDDSYEEGFVHWVNLPGGKSVRVVCGGGMDGKGFDPTNCKICNHMVEGYREARNLEAEDAKAADAMRKELNKCRANYSAEFLAVKGELLTVKDPVTKKKTLSADFDEYEVGILALTEAQFNGFVGLINNENYPFMKSNADLLNRVIILDKRKRAKNGKEAKYASVEFVPLKNKFDSPEIEFDKEEFDTKKDFEIDEEKIEKAFAYLNGGDEYEEAEEADDEIEYEDEDGEIEDGEIEDGEIEDGEIEDDEEIEDDDDEEIEVEDDDEIEDEEIEDEENDLSDIEEELDDDFEDDIPWQDGEEEKTPPKSKFPPKTKTSPRKKPVTGKKPAATKKPTVTKKSGKASVAKTSKTKKGKK